MTKRARFTAVRFRRFTLVNLYQFKAVNGTKCRPHACAAAMCVDHWHQRNEQPTQGARAKHDMFKQRIAC